MKIASNYNLIYNSQNRNKNYSANCLHSNIQDNYKNKSYDKTTKEPCFTGFWKLFSKTGKNTVVQSANSLTKSGISLDDKALVLSAKQIKNVKREIANEIFDLIKSPYTPAKAERMDKLVNSPYIDYQQEVYPYYLEDLVTFRQTTNNNKLYNRFLLHSLAKTMPLDSVDSKILEDLYKKNDSVMLLFKSYLQMDEKSQDAQLVKDMILRLKKHNVNIKDYPAFFADCLLNGKTKMCKFLQETFGFNPETRVQIVHSDKEMVDTLSKNYAASTRKNLPDVPISYRSKQKDNVLIVYNQKFCSDVDNDYLYYKLQNNSKEMTLWDVEHLYLDSKTPRVFDIPKYISENLADKTVIVDDYPYRLPASTDFVKRNINKYTELQSFNFLENLAVNLKANGRNYIKDIENINLYTNNFLNSDKKLDDAYNRLSQLKRDYTPEAQEKFDIVKQLYILIGKKCDIKESVLKNKLDELNKMPVEGTPLDAFINYENVVSLNQLNLQQKRELLDKLIKNKSNLLDCKLGEIVNVKFLPKNNSEYCELVAKLSNSIGLNVKKLPEETIKSFNHTMDEISKTESQFMHIDFDGQVKRLKLDYSLDDFKKDIWYSIKDLSSIERGKVLDYYGFELKNNNGKLVLNGFPNLQGSEYRLSKIKDEKIMQKIRDCEQYVYEFTRNNNIRINGYPQASKDISEIFKVFTELLTTVGKIQSSSHDFSLDIHTMKVLQNIFKSPAYQKLPPESKNHLRLAALFHDLTKAEGVVDKMHPDSSAFDVYYLLQKLDLSEKDKLKIYQIIKNHTWLEQYNNQKGSEDFIKNLAFDLRQDDAFKLSSILTQADLKSVKRNEVMYDRLKETLEKAYDNIKPHIYNLQKTAINLPQTKIPKANKLNLNSDYVSEINSDGVHNVVLHLKNGTNLKDAGFNSDVSIDDLNVLVHGLDDKDSASMFQALGVINSNAMLSASYINYTKGNWKVFRKQGFVMSVPASDIHAAYWRDFGSGYKKEKADLIKNYLFSNNEMRNYFSNQLKDELKLGDKEYIDLYRKIEDLPIEELDKKYPDTAKAYRNIFSKMEIQKRGFGRNYNEILVCHPKIQAIFCYDKSPESIPKYLRMYAQKHNIPILSFE